MYLQYLEYADLGGTMDSATFYRALPYAEAKLNELTPAMAHPLTVTPAVKQAVVFLCDNYAKPRFILKEKEIESFSNDGVSVRYRETSVRENDAEIRSVIRSLLPAETYLGVRARC